MTKRIFSAAALIMTVAFAIGLATATPSPAASVPSKADNLRSVSVYTETELRAIFGTEVYDELAKEGWTSTQIVELINIMAADTVRKSHSAADFAAR